MSDIIKPVPLDVTERVKRFVQKGHDDAERSTNVTFAIDASKQWELHRLAGDIYAAGFAAGHLVGQQEER